MISGLGLATCKRLIDEFVQDRAGQGQLHLIFTTRGGRKAQETQAHLQDHLCKNQYGDRKISVQAEELDLMSVESVYQLAERLGDTILHLDVLICNAGTAGTVTIDYWQALLQTCSSFLESYTYPNFKSAKQGEMAGPQTRRQTVPPQARLGKIFATNVFGHYMLGHRLMPLLHKAPDSGRIIFVSSLEAYAASLSRDDVQGIAATHPYESSKRLVDALVLTAGSPPNKSLVRSFTNERSPLLLLAHPGICLTSVVPLSTLLTMVTMCVFYLCRLLGSPWHTTTAYSGACAPVWLALCDHKQLVDLEGAEGKSKWGSAKDRRGHESVVRTEVEGWGTGGIVGQSRSIPGRGQGHINELTSGRRHDFDMLGHRLWQEMEALRHYWERWYATDNPDIQ